MKILYVSAIDQRYSAWYRMLTLERLGETVYPVDVREYEPTNRLLSSAQFRLSMGPGVVRINRDILGLAEEHRPEVFWADKALSLWPSTLKKLRAMGTVSVNYMPDNPFGPRRDPGWRLYMKDIPEFDLTVVPRQVSVGDFKQRGANDVMTVQFAYEETMHFPPPEGWSDEDRDREVSFIGSPYDRRGEIFSRLSAQGVPMTVSGSGNSWAKALGPEMFPRMFREGELTGPQYREGIWRSKINLSFITHSNADEFAHKSFEIAACGGFLLAERSEGHTSRFVEDEEAVFFTGEDELLAKIRRYLPDEAGRARIAAAGRARAVRSGYGNDTQVGLILDRVKALRG